MFKGLQNYTDYMVKAVHPVKNGYGFRIVLKYEDGTEKTQQRAGFSSKKEAEEERCITIGELKNRAYLVYANVLVKDYFIHWLEDDVMARRNNYNTYRSYINIINKYIIPAIGNKRISAVNTADITRLYNKALEVSGNIARQTRVVVNTCLKYAVSERAVAINVAESVRLPKGIKTAPYHSRVINIEKTLNHDQIMKLIEGCRGTSLHLMILFNVIMGLRCSEIIGLKYEDVDFVSQKLYVKRQLGRDMNISREEALPKTYTKQEIRLKTESSERILDIPDIVFETILQEKKQYNAHRNRRKQTFQDLGYICCSTYGRPRSRTFHFQPFKKLLRDLGLPDIRWHDLRSTAATVLLQAGFNPKAVPRVMGHSSEILTVDYYGDNHKLTAIILDRLDDYIETVLPVNDKKELPDKNDTVVRIDTAGYLPKS